VYVVDDDEAVRVALRMLLETGGHTVRTCGDAAAFLDSFDPGIPACVVLDLNLPGTSGQELLELLAARGQMPSIIFLTGHGDVPTAVRALKKGAMDFLQKPIVDEAAFLERVGEALRRSASAVERGRKIGADRARLQRLTPRESEIMEQICVGKANKVIAIDFGISERTVELHRSRVMRKLGVHSVAELVKLRDRLRN
jgi:FixJ family two-component response regulator